jgi:D-glycero-D-manno-heptose 1,7-bisphosphate phosphatase
VSESAGGPRRAVFMDRDGVLNALVERGGVGGSPRRREDFRLVPAAAEAVRRMHERGLLVFVITNQPDVARGHMSAAELEAMHETLRRSVRVDDIAVCPHDDTAGCACRKPQPGMLLSLAQRWNLDLKRSFVVGDSWRDVEAGRRAGCATIRLGDGRQDGFGADREVASLPEAMAVIEAALGPDPDGGLA